jgi:hypothetical protein
MAGDAKSFPECMDSAVRADMFVIEASDVIYHIADCAVNQPPTLLVTGSNIRTCTKPKNNRIRAGQRSACSKHFPFPLARQGTSTAAVSDGG